MSIDYEALLWFGWGVDVSETDEDLVEFLEGYGFSWKEIYENTAHANSYEPDLFLVGQQSDIVFAGEFKPIERPKNLDLSKAAEIYKALTGAEPPEPQLLFGVRVW